MVGGNEEDWKKYQAVNRARLVQSGIDPEESFNTFRGGLFVSGVMLAIIGIICLVLLC